MARRQYTPERIIGIVRQVEVSVSNGRSTRQACRKAGISLRGGPCSSGSVMVLRARAFRFVPHLLS